MQIKAWPENNMPEATREPQYNICLELRDRKGLASLGLMSNQAGHDDPKHLLFLLSRYKFVAKMLSGRQRVLEVGCADAFGTRVVQQEVGRVTAVDFDPVFVEDVHRRMDPRWPLECLTHDMLSGPVPGHFDAAYTLDVIEHIPQTQEDTFLRNICLSLDEHGVLIVGTPSLESQVYASLSSRAGHVNCKTHKDLRVLLERHFRQVFLFSMNDKVVHTGFYKMAHYLLGLRCSKR